MASISPAPANLTADRLLDELRRADVRVFLVPLRLLRRVVRSQGKLGRFGFHVPHRKSWILSRARAIELLAPDELGLADESSYPEVLILLIEPTGERLSEESTDRTLQRYWRLLFHARVHIAMDAIGLNDDGVAVRIAVLGRRAFDEVRAVLKAERFLLPGASGRTVYVEFAAVFLELTYFAPHALEAYFPSIEDPEAVARLLERDLDHHGLLRATNLGGVNLPPRLVHHEYEAELSEGDDPTTMRTAVEPSDTDWRALMLRAERETEKGNHVRAAILATRALRFASAAHLHKTNAEARAALDALIRRVRHAIEMTEVEAKNWRLALAPLLERASRKLWPHEARLLYDLQKIAVEKESEVFSIDLIGWIVSLGRRPLKQPLPYHREVRALKHLRDASKHLRRVKLAEPERQRLGKLLDLAAHHAEHHLRVRFRPLIARTLDACSFVPKTAPERASRRKLIEELIDKIVDHGFFRFGDLRDAFSRNQLKLDDLSGPREFLLGDPLLRTDKALATTLKGVYHRGEIYMRALQKFSSLLFGTNVGRLLTCFVILPVGGAFVALEGMTHLVAIFVKLYHGVEPELVNPFTWTIFAVVIMGAVNFPAYRSLLWHATKRIARAIKTVLYDLPRAVATLPPIRAVLESRVFRLALRWVVVPLVAAWFFWSLQPIHALLDRIVSSWSWFGRVVAERPRLPFFATTAALALFFNSRPGRDMGELFLEGSARLGRRLRVDVFAGLFNFVVRLFAALVEAFETVLYSVDEDLRFRSGENTLVLVLKGLVGAVWAVITYIARIYVNLLIEPQLNPIKHFPVVTVSHKVILPMTLDIVAVIRKPFLPLGTIAANTIAGGTVFLLPGVFGFLVWEFKENWKLYESNRSRRLLPERVGHHGETMRGFLRPGFHSGTIPNAFSQWRRAERKAQRRDLPALARKPKEKLHHVEESIRKFVDRAILFLLEESSSFGPGKLAVGNIELATNRVQVEIVAIEGRDGTCVVFEEIDGVLSARLEKRRWVQELEESPRNAIVNVLAGLFAMSQVERVPQADPPENKAVEVPWDSWVAAWDADAAGGEHPERLVGGFTILPPPSEGRA